MSSTSTSDKKLQLTPLSVLQIPRHPLLASIQNDTAPPPPLSTFITAILTSALHFADTTIHTTFSTKSAAKPSPPSAAKVKLLSSTQFPGEAWFARESVHDDAARPGTATYSEFESGLFDNHSQHEMEYTPNVFDHVPVLDWAEEIQKASGGAAADFGGFEDVHMSMVEMAHQIPSPLNNRVFAVLMVRAKVPPALGKPGFIVLQNPVDMRNVPQAMYSNGRHITEGSTAQKKAKIVLGAYTSVERVIREGSGTDDAANGAGDQQGKVRWVMGTASDAKGSLPMGLQKMGVPSAIVKDVGFFIDWVGKTRKA